MQILSADQIRAWDEFTIRHIPISSTDLMEKAAHACFKWLMDHGYGKSRFAIFCGKGNNGGDGLAIARLLARNGQNVSTYILEFGTMGTDDFQTNLARLRETGGAISFLTAEEVLPVIDNDTILIDALFGSGLNRPLEGHALTLVLHLNQSGNKIISVDIPGGLFADRSAQNNTVIRARHTLTFQCFKTAFLMAENEKYTGEVHVLDIGLHPDFLSNVRPAFETIDKYLVSSIIKPRKKFSHKGDYGHGALIAGSVGMMGAAVLSARAFMRSGGGKLTCHVPQQGYTIMQVSVPEAMCKIEAGEDHILSVDSLDNYDAVGIGPGLGKYESNTGLLSGILKLSRKPIVIDADALNCIARHSEMLNHLPTGCVITPHPLEFERLFGKSANDFERIQTVLKKAAEYKIVIVLKGAYTFIATPGGVGYFNTSGNPGMATAGTGDVLSGIIMGLLAQGYPPEQAAIAGVFLHGFSGDLAADRISQQSLTASDVIDYLGNAFQQLTHPVVHDIE